MACEWHANGMRKGILNSMRYTAPAAAPKTSDESPPWHAQLWHAPRHAPWYAKWHGIHVRILHGCARVTPPRELSPKLIIPGPVGRWRW